MNRSLSGLLSKFNLALEQQVMPDELGGFYRQIEGNKHIVVNNTLSYDKKIEICFDLIFKHCLDDRNSAYIPHYLFDESWVGTRLAVH